MISALFGPAGPKRVLVTGAGGKTGAIVVRKLLERGEKEFLPRALVRSEESGLKLKAELGDLAKDVDVKLGDITKSETLKAAFEAVDAVVIVTSAMPRLDKSSLVGVIMTKTFSLGMVSRKPSFWFDDGQSPEEVDWLGQVNQIDAAKAAGVKYIVLVSSMAGTKPDHFLNTQMDNIVLWKRKAECYLIDSGIQYTIIHPGGLLPHYGDSGSAPGGRRELYADVDDNLMAGKRALVPREDVAEVCVQCLEQPDVASGRAFDLGSGEEGEARAWKLAEVLAPLKDANCVFSQADSAFSRLEIPKAKDGGCFCF